MHLYIVFAQMELSLTDGSHNANLIEEFCGRDNRATKYTQEGSMLRQTKEGDNQGMTEMTLSGAHKY